MQKVDVCVYGTVTAHISCSECGQELEIVHSADDFGDIYFEVKSHTCASKENNSIKPEGQ